MLLLLLLSFCLEFNREQGAPDGSSTATAVTETTEQSEQSPGIVEQPVTATFVNDPEVQIQAYSN